ncbi:F-box protein CPR30-like [Cucumis melo var. makuwa]|uniref:F-box protein CPR30-like n=2 Tax=Cucumis melo TaxID=3656 RepID=A0A5A7UHP3_CUCMM|nr:F-box protein CPR30-like [Cucumis melo var. makuwa]
MASLGNLPDGVIIEILSRLPPESLLRFKCVRKSWYALFNDPKFKAKHFSTSLQHKHLLLKRLVTKDSGKKENIFSILKLPLSIHSSLSISDIDLPFHEDFRFFEIHGHSHGLLCLTDLRKDIFLCNPSTREFHQLPPSILLLPEPSAEPDDYDSSTNAVGFGYDSKSRDFKVVRVVDFVEGPGYFYPPKVEVYDLSKERWREIQTPVSGHVFWAPCFEVFHEGTYYWWADADGNTEIILTFDMSEEVFGQIPVPESFQGTGDWYRSLGVLDGRIVLFHYPSRGDERRFDMWEMGKDESGGVSWSKVLTIGPVSGIEKPLLFISSEELLMEGNGGQLIVYNIRSEEVKEVPIKGSPGRFQGTAFVKSLLSVKGGDSINYEF